MENLRFGKPIVYHSIKIKCLNYQLKILFVAQGLELFSCSVSKNSK